MSFRVITACVESKENAELLCKVASRLVGTNPSHVQAIHVMPAGYEYVAMSPYVQGVPLDRLYDRYEEIAEEIKQVYVKAQPHYPDSITWDWHLHDGFSLSDHTPYVNHAIVSDLVLCSKQANVALGAALPRTLVRESATPVLVVPEDIDNNIPFDRVTLAWNETPESARAIRDSLPLLKQASEVYVFSVNQDNDRKSLSGVDIGRYLGEHGIKVTIDHKATSNQIGQELLNHVRENFSDLLVMGGFGHSSIHNLLLGSATPQVLKELTCPVFMSH